ncbi:hypothetical protein GE278_04385 [Enterobacteriaceae bacterium Kacie_13]|nr:hypothetical protein GE278_04385 [Enterobacteriaceae bacterium Kacie_13]
MSWPIPKIPTKAVIHQPDYKRWGIILLVMALVGALLALFPGKATSYGQALLYGMLPAILLWLCFFGLVFHRYEQSVNAALLWNEETERTKQYWQYWSRKQQIVVGNVVLTPEKKGVDALLGNPADIPAYPEKARPLFADLSDLNEHLKFIDQEIEKQSPGYRHHLSKIVIQYQKKYQEITIDQAVYQQWDLYPEYADAPESFCAGDENELSGLGLLLCLQDWTGSQAEKYSEFITAQLITSGHFASQNALPVIAGVGRSLSSDSLTKALDMLSEYNRLEKASLRYVWLSGMDADERTRLVQHVTSKQWSLPERRPLISLDHSFGLPGPLMFPVAVSFLTDAAKQTGEMQLFISRNEENMYSLCLITRELFS